MRCKDVAALLARNGAIVTRGVDARACMHDSRRKKFGWALEPEPTIPAPVDVRRHMYSA